MFSHQKAIKATYVEVKKCYVQSSRPSNYIRIYIVLVKTYCFIIVCAYQDGISMPILIVTGWIGLLGVIKIYIVLLLCNFKLLRDTLNEIYITNIR